MSKRDALHDVEVTFVRSAPNVWWVKNHHNVMVTLPRSRVDFPDEPREGTTITLEVPGWLCEEKDLL